MRSVIILSVFLIACAPQTNYQESELDVLSKKNQTIVPNGTYESEGLIGAYNIPVMYINNSNLVLEFLDSNENHRKVNGVWNRKTTDTQFFSFPAPFSQAIFTAGGIYFLDSNRRFFFEKTSDSILVVPMQDSLNLTE